MEFTTLVSPILILSAAYCNAQEPVKKQRNLKALELTITAPEVGKDYFNTAPQSGYKGLFNYHETPKTDEQPIPLPADSPTFSNRQSTTYNMPCYTPDSNSQMPIIVPDSTIRHSLIISDK